jgi:glyoxylase-like metal-dependent hydrolase (beta-lactamase superfamily II)
MKRGFLLGTLVIGGLLAAGVAARQQQPPAPGGARGGPGRGPQAPPTPSALAAEKVRDNLYVIRSADPANFTGGNTAVLIRSDGVTLVDTKIPGWGMPLIAKVKELTDKPVTTIINTHTHFDHVGGNPDFAPTVEIVAQENTARLMKESNPVTGLQTGPQPNIFKESGGRGLPTRTFKDRLTLGRGNERVELYYFGRAHTGGDAFVLFPALRVLHTGDAFAAKGVPIMDANNGGSGVEYADTLSKAAALPNVDTVITGHAPVQMTMADLKEYADYNREFVEYVRAAKKAGKNVDDAVKWAVPDRFLKSGYTQPMPMALRSNAQVVWNELR